MLTSTWLGFSRAEKGCRKEGKKFRRGGNFRKHYDSEIKEYCALLSTRCMASGRLVGDFSFLL